MSALTQIRQWKLGWHDRMLGGLTYTFFQVVDIRLEKHEVGGKGVRPKRVHDAGP
jgi:hypothetical protein